MDRQTFRPFTSEGQPSRASYQSHGGRDWTRRCALGAVGGFLATLVVACGSLKCQPVPVTVAQKEERSRLEMVSHGTFSSQTGQLKEVRVPEAVRDYWVRGQDGTWYRVSEDKFRALEVGETVELCR